MTATTPFPDRLDVARRVLTTINEHSDEFREAVRQSVPVWWADQLAAASAETVMKLPDTARLLRRLEPDRWSDHDAYTLEATLDQAALLLAALLGCGPCAHLRQPPARQRPTMIFADLNHRLILCDRCARTWRAAIDDDRCEICDGPLPGGTHTPFLITWHGVVCSGHLGSCCSSALLVDEASR